MSTDLILSDILIKNVYYQFSVAEHKKKEEEEAVWTGEEFNTGNDVYESVGSLESQAPARPSGAGVPFLWLPGAPLPLRSTGRRGSCP